MNRETLLAELGRLLEVGEPLLTMFPKDHQEDWSLVLPDNISDEMAWYADSVAWRAWDRTQLEGLWKRVGKNYLAGRVRDCEVGLLGWRAIGVLK